MSDFDTYTVAPDSPPSDGFAISPSDTQDLTKPIRGLMVAAAGHVTVQTLRGGQVTLPALQPGIQYSILATRVFSSGTTATGIVGLA